MLARRTAPLCLLALLAAAVCLGVYTGVDALSDMDRYYQPMHNGPRETARQKDCRRWQAGWRRKSWKRP